MTVRPCDGQSSGGWCGTLLASTLEMQSGPGRLRAASSLLAVLQCGRAARQPRGALRAHTLSHIRAPLGGVGEAAALPFLRVGKWKQMWEVL